MLLNEQTISSCQDDTKRLIRDFVKRNPTFKGQEEDLFQEAAINVMEWSLRYYNKKKGSFIKFYNNNLLRFITLWRNRSLTNRQRELETKEGFTDRLIVARRLQSACPRISVFELKEALSKLLNKKELDVVLTMANMNGGESLNMSECAREIKVSRQAVHQCLKRLRPKIVRALERGEL